MQRHLASYRRDDNLQQDTAISIKVSPYYRASTHKANLVTPRLGGDIQHFFNLLAHHRTFILCLQPLALTTTLPFNAPHQSRWHHQGRLGRPSCTSAKGHPAMLVPTHASLPSSLFPLHTTSLLATEAAHHLYSATQSVVAACRLCAQ